MITAIDKAIKFAFTVPTGLPHAISCATFLKGLACLPALAARYLVRLHLQSILFDASEDVKPPVIPHRRPRLDYVIGLWMKPWQILYRCI